MSTVGDGHRLEAVEAERMANSITSRATSLVEKWRVVRRSSISARFERPRSSMTEEGVSDHIKGMNEAASCIAMRTFPSLWK